MVAKRSGRSAALCGGSNVEGMRRAASSWTRAAHDLGCATFRWEQVEGAPPDFINPYQLVINGRPVRMLGSNIIPPDLLFGRMDDRGPRLIQLAHAADMNTLRIWGGGAFLTERMYDPG